MVVRTYEEECAYLEKVSPCEWRIKKGFVSNMLVKTKINNQPLTPNVKDADNVLT